MANILCVDDESSIGMILEDTLTRVGHRAIIARNVAEAMQLLSRESVDLIISDYKMPGLTGLEFLELLQREAFDIPLIMVTGYGSIEHAVAAIKAGAIDYITKPIRSQQLVLAVEQALEFVRLRRENEALRREVLEFRNARQIIGESAPMRAILQTVATVAPTGATVLLQGESGTGKELIARAIHDLSDRRDRPFIKVSCAALSEDLLESALFGHERGAITGAMRRVEGAFERANGGTLLLDEISEIKPGLQSKLLRALQEQEFERVGGSSAIRVDSRIIATTSRDLAAAAEAGTFLQDLYRHLAGVAITIAPLRERPDDIPLLALRFAMRAAADIDKQITGIVPEAIARLLEYPWPGNVRELQHVVERAVILSHDSVLHARHFAGQQLGIGNSLSIQARAHLPGVDSDSSQTMSGTGAGVVLQSLNVDEAERALIKRALEVTADNRTKAAALLGISVRTLRNKLNARPTPAPTAPLSSPAPSPTGPDSGSPPPDEAA